MTAAAESCMGQLSDLVNLFSDVFSAENMMEAAAKIFEGIDVITKTFSTCLIN